MLGRADTVSGRSQTLRGNHCCGKSYTKHAIVRRTDLALRRKRNWSEKEEGSFFETPFQKKKEGTNIKDDEILINKQAKHTAFITWLHLSRDMGHAWRNLSLQPLPTHQSGLIALPASSRHLK